MTYHSSVESKNQSEQVGHFASSSWEQEKQNMQCVYGLKYLKQESRGEHSWEAPNGLIWRI